MRKSNQTTHPNPKEVSNIQPKYNLTPSQNIFLAKRNIVSNIYNSAKLEGCNVTFPETQTILDGVNVGSVTLDDIQTVLNLRDAWQFTIANLAEAFNLDFICKVNAHVSRNESLQWGVLRTGKVGISGTDYVPPVPIKEAVDAEIARILNIKSATKRAITFFLWACHAQLFWDGNKRTSMICANKLLIEAGAGILTVKDTHIMEFNKRLLQYYNSGDMSVIDQWLYDNCIDGIEFAE